MMMRIFLYLCGTENIKVSLATDPCAGPAYFSKTVIIKWMQITLVRLYIYVKFKAAFTPDAIHTAVVSRCRRREPLWTGRQPITEPVELKQSIWLC